MSKTLRPLGDRVLVKRSKELEKTKGGIIIPDAAKEKPVEGEVLAVGPGRTEHGVHIEMRVKKGDHVLFGKYAGTDIELDEGPAVVLREDDLLGVLEG